jgi:hypothetical protein
MAEQPQSERSRSGEFGRMAGLAVVLAIALVLRLIGITWGLPDETHLFSYHPDEFHSLRGAISLALGDANPHFFNYGSLYLYLVAAAAALAHPGIFASIISAAPGGPELPEALHTWTLDARVVTVLLAVGTVAVVYATARRIWGHREGLAAGLLLALAPLHVLQSHYATVDVPGAFFTALACYFAVAMLREPTWRNVLAAGAAAGLAASVKYSGAVAIIAPIIAWAIVRFGERDPDERPSWAMLPALAGAAFAAFALTSPYTFLDWQSAWRDISFELQHMRTGDDPAMMALYPSGPAFHAGNLALGSGYVMLAAALVGLVGSLALRRREPWPLLAFGLLAFGMIAGAEVRYARYAVSILPVIAVLAAGVVSDDMLATVQGRWETWARAAAVSLLLLASVLSAGIIDHRILRELTAGDARAEALTLLQEQVPVGERIGLITEPWFYHPPVDYCNGGVALRDNPLWAAYRRPVRDLAVLGLDPESLREASPRVVVLTGFEVGVPLLADDPGAGALVAALREQGYHRVAEFRGNPWPGGGARALAQDLSYPFPWIEVWRRGGLVTGVADGGMIAADERI